MSPNVKGVLRFLGGLVLMALGLVLVFWDAYTTEAGRVALHTPNVIVAMVLFLAGGLIVDPGWIGQLVSTAGGAVGNLLRAKAGGSSDS